LTILFAGMVAELIFMPALLAGPLGAVFKPRRRPTSDNSTDRGHDREFMDRPEPAGSAIETGPSFPGQLVTTPHLAPENIRSSVVMRSDSSHARRVTE